MCHALCWVLGTGGIPALKELTERQEIWAITKQLVTVLIKVPWNQKRGGLTRPGDQGKLGSNDS